jgi:hypothetical protein
MEEMEPDPPKPKGGLMGKLLRDVEVPTTFECLGEGYNLHVRCAKCPQIGPCAEDWSRRAWNLHKKEGYGRSLSDDWN